MFKRFNNFNYLFSPDDATGKSGSAAVAEPSKNMSVNDIVDFLKDDDIKDDKDVIDLDEKDDKSDKSDKKDKSAKDKDKDEEIEVEDKEEDEDKDKDELQELEEELEEPTDEQLELVTPVRRKEILEKYPKLFKDFPYLEKAYYREQQFTEIFPTIPDAKASLEKSEILDKFETDLMAGNTEIMLNGVKNTDPKAFNKIVDNYLVTLSKVDDKAYHHVIGNTIKHTIMAMVQEGTKSDNAALKSAAQILNQFVFGSSDFVPPTPLSKNDKTDETDDEKNRLSEKERAFTERQLKTAVGDLNTKVNNAYKSTIEAHIDPRDSMSDYVRKNAVRECIESLDTLIKQDKRFTVLVDKLWEKAATDDYSQESVNRIRSAFLSRAKTLLPAVIKKARNEALRGMGKRVVEDKDEKETPQRRVSSNTRREDNDKPQSKNKSGKIPAGMSSLDFLMSED